MNAVGFTCKVVTNKSKIYFPGNIVSLYKSSTFFLAQGVRLRKTRLDLMPGSLLKQLIGIIRPSSTQPNSATSSNKIISSVLPCIGSLLFGRDSSLLIGTCEIQCEYRSFFPSGKLRQKLPCFSRPQHLTKQWVIKATSLLFILDEQQACCFNYPLFCEVLWA